MFTRVRVVREALPCSILKFDLTFQNRKQQLHERHFLSLKLSFLLECCSHDNFRSLIMQMVNILKSVWIILLFVISYSPATAQFRVVGYVHFGRIIPDLTKISFNRLTHLNIAFVNPDSTGALQVPNGMDSVIHVAHLHQVKVLASIGGGSHNPYYAGLLKEDSREVFVKKLLQLVIDHNLDGIDVDLENEVIDHNYGAFVTDLAGLLKPINKLLTAALATWNAQKIPDSALHAFDFINIMSYDQRGPWRPTEPGPHSTYEKAVEDLQYWKEKRNVAAHRINLGVPFYGYVFHNGTAGSMRYGDIAGNFRRAHKKDQLKLEEGGTVYYNGNRTIRKKTTLALDEAGGIMIWQLLQDHPGRYSLLKEIDKTRRKRQK